MFVKRTVFKWGDKTYVTHLLVESVRRHARGAAGGLAELAIHSNFERE